MKADIVVRDDQDKLIRVGHLVEYTSQAGKKGHTLVLSKAEDPETGEEIVSKKRLNAFIEHLVAIRDEGRAPLINVFVDTRRNTGVEEQAA